MIIFLHNENFTAYFSFDDRLQFPSNAYVCMMKTARPILLQF